MKSTFSITLFLLSMMVVPAFLQAQSVLLDSSNKSIEIAGDYNGAEIHLAAVKKRPEFPGGKNAWQEFLRSRINLKVPFANKAKPGNYQVMIRFIADSEGKLWNIGADTNRGYGLEKEVIRVIKKSDKWIPAETSTGKRVSFTLRTAVTFIVKQNDVFLSFN